MMRVVHLRGVDVAPVAGQAWVAAQWRVWRTETSLNPALF